MGSATKSILGSGGNGEGRVGRGAGLAHSAAPQVLAAVRSRGKTVDTEGGGHLERGQQKDVRHSENWPS